MGCSWRRSFFCCIIFRLSAQFVVQAFIGREVVSAEKYVMRPIVAKRKTRHGALGENFLATNLHHSIAACWPVISRDRSDRCLE